MHDPETQRKEVIRRILDLEKSDQSMTDDSVRSRLGDLHQQACQHFGTWPVALQYAGVRLVGGTSQSFVPELLIKRIRRRCANLYSMRATFVRKADYSLYRGSIAMFGSWQNAMAQAGIEKERLYFGPNNPRLTRESALEMLSHRIATSGTPTLVLLACENQYLVRCLVARFGSFQTALRLATTNVVDISAQSGLPSA